MITAAPKELTTSVDKLVNALNNNLKGYSKAGRSKSATSIKGMLRSYKGGKRGVYVRVTINREHEYFPTGYYVDAKYFDVATGLVAGRDQDKEEINSYVRYLAKELDDVLTTLKKSGDVISIENFNKHYSKRVKKDLSFEEYFKAALEDKRPNIEASTAEVYSRLLTKIKEFRPNVSIQSIDKKFITDWEDWLKHSKGLCQNTTNHYLHTLRTFLIKAKDDEVIETAPFDKIKISHIDGDRDYLAQEELDALIKLDIPDYCSGEQRAREMFVFCCITGIRYSDLVALKWSHVRTLTGDLHFQMQKTKFFVTIPLVDKAKEILSNQDRNSEFVFKKISNQKFNEHLHNLERKAGIQKSITVHVARHTFATLALERGVPLEVVSKILGHRNIKTTMIYAKITTKTLQTEMQKLNGMFNSLQKSPKAGDMSGVILLKMQEIMELIKLANNGTPEVHKIAS